MSEAGTAATPRAEGLPYHLILRSGRPGAWWRSLIGIEVLPISMFVVMPFLVLVPFMAGLAVAGQDVMASTEQLVDLTDPTPLGLAYINVVLASAIPVTWMLIRYLHGLRPRWLSSILPRLRWRYLLVCFGLSFVALLATLAVAAVLPSQGAGTEMSGELNDFTTTTREFLLVVLFLTPTSPRRSAGSSATRSRRSWGPRSSSRSPTGSARAPRSSSTGSRSGSSPAPSSSSPAGSRPASRCTC